MNTDKKEPTRMSFIGVCLCSSVVSSPSFSKYAREDFVDVAQLFIYVEKVIKLLARQLVGHPFVVHYKIAEVRAFVPHAHRKRLHDGICVFAGDTFARQLQQQLPARSHATQRLEIRP